MNLLKTKPVRNKAYLRWVASLPCMLCGIHDASQAAHIHLRGQKSTGKKVDDNQVIPLCCERGNNCHSQVDRYETKIDRPNIVQRAKVSFGFWENNNKQDAKELLRLW